MADNKQRLYPGLHAPQKKKSSSTLSAIIIVLVVVAGASIGGYWLHQKFSSHQQKSAGTADSAASSTNAASAQAPDIAESSALPETSTDSSPPLASTEGTKRTTPAETVETSTTVEVITTTENTEKTASTTDSTSSTVTSAPTSTTPASSTTEKTSNTTVEIKEPAASQPPAVTSPAESALLKNPTAAIKKSDKLYAAGKFKEAKNLLKSLLNYKGANSARILPSVLYRLGLICRQTKQENDAQKYWTLAYQTYPADPSGRLSALALADTWYYWYVKSKKDISKWEKIREAYSAVLGMDGARFLPLKTEAEVAARLNQLNQELIWNPRVQTPGAIFHKVKSGEYISTIARKYNLDTWTQIPDLNHIDPKKIREGMILKIMPGRLFILIDKKRFTLDAYLDGKFLKRYRCATGAPQTETPAGRYIITKMDVNPTWTDPDTGKLIQYGQPGHPIGTRWLAMQGGQTRGLGIHGTVVPKSIGTKASNGCIRLLNKDVEQLYGFASIEPGNETEVMVIE